MFGLLTFSKTEKQGGKAEMMMMMCRNVHDQSQKNVIPLQINSYLIRRMSPLQGAFYKGISYNGTGHVHLSAVSGWRGGGVELQFICGIVMDGEMRDSEIKNV